MKRAVPLVPHSSPRRPVRLDPDVLTVFMDHPVLAETCGRLFEALPQSGLTNRVFRLSAETGNYFLRLPRLETAGMIDRHAEFQNLKLAADLGLAVSPVHCDPASGVLLTPAIETLGSTPENFPKKLGALVGKLHASGANFEGVLQPNAVYEAQKSVLSSHPELLREFQELDHELVGLVEQGRDGFAGVKPVPSHGDLSPGNCLVTKGQLWLIDWEYSGMSDPAWDLAYASLEHGFSDVEDGLFLEGYMTSGAGRFLPCGRRLGVMKSRCDAVSALWALEQVASGRDAEVFRPFAQERLQRALSRLR